jgi:hypothetical protein
MPYRFAPRQSNADFASGRVIYFAQHAWLLIPIEVTC